MSKTDECTGVSCAFCSLFTVTGTGGEHHSSGDMKLGDLVLKPLKKFHKLTGKNGDLTLHCTTEYHKTCAGKANEFFIRSVAGSVADVRNLQDKARRHSIIKNQKKIKSVVDTLLFCGLPNLPLRGHRDSVRIQKEEPAENDGNFRALLRFRMRAGIK